MPVITFKSPNGEEKEIDAPVGASLLKSAQAGGVALQGACGGSCACATCHVILNEEDFQSLGEISEQEEDMLDMAFNLTQTSRLSCQIKVSANMDGWVIKLPA